MGPEDAPDSSGTYGENSVAEMDVQSLRTHRSGHRGVWDDRIQTHGRSGGMLEYHGRSVARLSVFGTVRAPIR